MHKICYPTVAGMFYPADSEELFKVVTSYIGQVKKHYPVPKAIISPHAGYDYSGPIAASAFACLKGSNINRVVVLGPSHRFSFHGVAVPDADVFLTPLGEISIDQDKIKDLIALPQVKVSEQAFSIQENSIETQLPFLQVILKNFKLIPILIGNASDQQVEEVLETLWNGTNTLIVVSSDLSHYYDYDTANRIDKKTAEYILHLNANLIEDDHVCGSIGVRALLNVVIKKRLKAYLIDLRNSGDTAGLYEQVVGYGAFHFRE